MKKVIMFSTIALAMTIAACSNATKTDENNSATEQKQTTESAAFVRIDTTKLAAGVEFYQCPMHPEEVTDKNVPCPQCGMDLDKVVKK
jgi:hypothetical protein